MRSSSVNLCFLDGAKRSRKAILTVFGSQARSLGPHRHPRRPARDPAAVREPDEDPIRRGIERHDAGPRGEEAERGGGVRVDLRCHTGGRGGQARGGDRVGLTDGQRQGERGGSSVGGHGDRRADPHVDGGDAEGARAGEGEDAVVTQRIAEGDEVGHGGGRGGEEQGVHPADHPGRGDR